MQLAVIMTLIEQQKVSSTNTLDNAQSDSLP